MATARPTTIRQTGFKVGTIDARFELVWPDGEDLMTDWEQTSNWVDLDGANLTVTQLIGVGPRRATYRILCESVDDYRTLVTLVQQTGTLTLYHHSHSTPESAINTVSVHASTYDRVVSATLLELTDVGLVVGGMVMADALFQVTL